MATAVELGGDVAALGVGPPHDADLAPLILITTVDIGEGRSDRIEVRQGDDPVDLARAFVQKHSLPPAITEALAQHLRDNLREAAQQQHGPQLRNSKAGQLTSNRTHGNYARSEGASETDTVVFERLYQQAIVLRSKMQEKKLRIAKEQETALSSTKHNMSWISQEMMRERSSGPYENYGEMLYAESLEGLARRRQKADRERAERAAEELSSATFQPEISRLAQQLWSRHDSSSVPAWQRLSKGKKTKTTERLELLRKEREAAETRECTFKPAISKKSDKLMSDRGDTLKSLNLSAHQQLYQDSLRRQQKQEAYANWYPEDVTFQPKLVAAQRPGSNSPREAGGSATPLVERLYASYERLQSKLSEARAKLDGPVDPVTGRPLYQPQTGRGPTFARHAPQQAVGEYLYSLQTEKDEKARQRLEEESQRADEARKAKVAASSTMMVRKLQRKRFQQVFEFLDKDATNYLDMAELLKNPAAECLEELDDDVRADLETAARIACRAASERSKVKHQESGGSSASFFMPPPPTADLRAGKGSSAPSSPRAPVDPTKVPLDVFCSLMEQAIASKPRPRAYLAPTAPQKYVPSETFVPTIDERSKQLAARLRPKDTPLHELLHREATNISAKKAAMRAAAQDAAMRECTFVPRLVSEQLVPEGRVMKEVREGTYSHPMGISHLIDEDSALAALVAAAQEAEAAAAGAPSGSGACSAGLMTPRSPKVGAAAPRAEAPLAGSDGSAFMGGLHELAAQLDAEAAAAASSSYATTGPVPALLQEQGEEEEEQEEGCDEECEVGVCEDEGDVEDALTVERSQFMELEREVEAMLEATSAAAAAAERLTNKSDQRYLSKILGLTQEAVDAMQPAMSSLPGWESRHSHSRNPSSVVAGGADSPTSPSVPEAPLMAPHHEPLISPDAAEGAGAAPQLAVRSVFSVGGASSGKSLASPDGEAARSDADAYGNGNGGSGTTSAPQSLAAASTAEAPTAAAPAQARDLIMLDSAQSDSLSVQQLMQPQISGAAGSTQGVSGAVDQLDQLIQ